MSLSKNTGIVTLISIAFVAIASRLIPHPFNFTAIGAIALFSGAVIKDKRIAYLFPLVILFITDLIIGFHVSMLPVYGCFMFTVWMGTKVSSNVKWFKIIGASLLSSIVFFLVTNLPVWYLNLQLYPVTFNGTVESYIMALPFFRNQVLGDLFYNVVLFGVYFSLPTKDKLTLIRLKK